MADKDTWVKRYSRLSTAYEELQKKHREEKPKQTPEADQDTRAAEENGEDDSSTNIDWLPWLALGIYAVGKILPSIIPYILNKPKPTRSLI